MHGSALQRLEQALGEIERHLLRQCERNGRLGAKPFHEMPANSPIAGFGSDRKSRALQHRDVPLHRPLPNAKLRPKLRQRPTGAPREELHKFPLPRELVTPCHEVSGEQRI